MHDIWNPWHGCTKCSEGCQNCYMYFLDRVRDRNGADIYKTKLKRSEGDNPTIGIVLCSDTDEDIAKYLVLHGNEQLFASK